MIVSVHAGHNAQGLKGSGASAILKESVENRKIAKLVVQKLAEYGDMDVYNHTVDDGTSQQDVLNRVTTAANDVGAELMISIHLNAGGGTGCEAWIWPGNNRMTQLGETWLHNMEVLGWRNRGVKSRDSLYVLKHSKMNAILFECGFVDSVADASRFDPETFANAIVAAIATEYGLKHTSQVIEPVKPCGCSCCEDCRSIQECGLLSEE